MFPTLDSFYVQSSRAFAASYYSTVLQSIVGNDNTEWGLTTDREGGGMGSSKKKGGGGAYSTGSTQKETLSSFFLAMLHFFFPKKVL